MPIKTVEIIAAFQPFISCRELLVRNDSLVLQPLLNYVDRPAFRGSWLEVAVHIVGNANESTIQGENLEP